MAICCPIAPYAAARAFARAQATAAGAGFVLVHVATPLEVCEQRDRKGLYAKARAGLITGMTGIDDPYEEPTDAEIVVDTSRVRVDEAQHGPGPAGRRGLDRTPYACLTGSTRSREPGWEGFGKLLGERERHDVTADAPSSVGRLRVGAPNTTGAFGASTCRIPVCACPLNLKLLESRRSSCVRSAVTHFSASVGFGCRTNCSASDNRARAMARSPRARLLPPARAGIARRR